MLSDWSLENSIQLTVCPEPGSVYGFSTNLSILLRISHLNKDHQVGLKRSLFWKRKEPAEYWKSVYLYYN